MVIINAQIEMFKSYLVVGGGHRTTLLLSPIYIPPEYLTQTAIGGVRGSHNLTMSILADHGIVGGFLYAMIIVSALSAARRLIVNRQNEDIVRLLALGLFAGYVGVFAASQFSNSKVMEISFWLFAFITALSLNNTNDNKEKAL